MQAISVSRPRLIGEPVGVDGWRLVIEPTGEIPLQSYTVEPDGDGWIVTVDIGCLATYTRRFSSQCAAYQAVFMRMWACVIPSS